ncbi:cation:proton antiporter [Fluviicola sp.]|uniref:cation:proton antiporter n=1 Tax=Fluviicola sp. TaxID=1917219 RepID=UPI0026021B3D|nr:cation:proton antiporter [Fluviicola sp.]
METSVIIITIGFFIFCGHFLSGVFERRSIPDVLGLMFLGILLGPVFHIVNPDSFGQFGSLFSNFVLVFILFESGTDLKISEVRKSFKDSAGITTIGFLFTTITISILCNQIFHLSWVTSLFIGSALGGTSSAVVVGLVKKVDVQPKTSTTLIIESAETDVFTLAIPLAILGLMVSGDFSVKTLISQFITSLILAIVFGVLGALFWAFILNKLPTLKATKFSTPAFLFLLYGLSEYLGYSGPLTALTFGIVIGNLSYFEPKILRKIVPNQRIVLPEEERAFFSEIVFLLRTFFFVFIGISIRINRMDWLLLGALITFIVYLVRIIVVKLVISSETPVLDRAVMSFMIPKGLGAAVIATLPVQQGHPDGAIIQSICFAVILSSTVYCVLFFFLVKTGFSMPFYRLVYGRRKREAKK